MQIGGLSMNQQGGFEASAVNNQGVLGIDEPLKVVISLKTKEKEKPKKLIDIEDLLRKRTPDHQGMQNNKKQRRLHPETTSTRTGIKRRPPRRRPRPAG